MKVLSKDKVAQRITPGRIRWFRKEVLEIRGPEKLAVVRKRPADGSGHPPIILIHGFGQNHYAWHIPERSMANYLADLGFDVFNVDLRGHGRSAELGSARSRGVDCYIREDIPAVIDAVLALTGFSRVFLIGHSLGGLCAAAVAARDPERVAGVITMGPPHALGRGHFVLGNVLRLAGHTLSRSGLIRGSQSRLPVDLIGKAVHATRFAWNSKFAPIPVRGWKPGSFSTDELRSYLRSFDGASWGTADELCKLAMTGELRSRVDGSSFTRAIEESPVPILAVSGSADLLANPGAVKPIFERSKARDKRYLKVDAGHGDLLVGSQAPDHVWPVVGEWLLSRRHYLEKPAVAGARIGAVRIAG